MSDAIQAIAERFPDTPVHARPGLAAMRYAPIEDRPDKAELIRHVLDRALMDETLAEIAADVGVSRSGLNLALLRHAETAWKEVQAARAVTHLEDAETEVRNAQDGLTLARGREVLRAAQWKLERLLRRLYGQDAPQINVAGDGVTIQVVNYQPQGTEP